jgi:hypothetical protein
VHEVGIECVILKLPWMLFVELPPDMMKKKRENETKKKKN